MVVIGQLPTFVCLLSMGWSQLSFFVALATVTDKSYLHGFIDETIFLQNQLKGKKV